MNQPNKTFKKQFLKESEFIAYNLIHKDEYYISVKTDENLNTYYVQHLDENEAVTLLKDAYENPKVGSNKMLKYGKGVEFESLMNYYHLMSDGLKENAKVVQGLLEINYKTFPLLSNKLKSNKEFIDYVLNKDKDFIKNVSPEILKDRNFALEYLTKYKGVNLNCFTDFLNDKEIVDVAITHCPDALEHITESPLIKDKALIYKAVSYSAKTLKFVPEDLKDDELVLLAFKQVSSTILYASEKFKMFPELLIIHNFWSFFNKCEIYSLEGSETKSQLETIRDVFLSHVNESVSLNLKDVIKNRLIISKPIQDIEFLVTDNAEDKNLINKLDNYLSCFLPYWPLNDVQELANAIESHATTQKEKFQHIFNKEYKRRAIHQITLKTENSDSLDLKIPSCQHDEHLNNENINKKKRKLSI
jgi:hypothetical protein